MEKEHLQILLEDVKDKFELIIKGLKGLRHEIKDMHQEMNERFWLLDFKLEALSTKIDGVASNLAAHRADTESHPKGYKVSDVGSEA
jgi:hypothetical protein